MHINIHLKNITKYYRITVIRIENNDKYNKIYGWIMVIRIVEGNMHHKSKALLFTLVFWLICVKNRAYSENNFLKLNNILRSSSSPWDHLQPLPKDTHCGLGVSWTFDKHSREPLHHLAEQFESLSVSGTESLRVRRPIGWIWACSRRRLSFLLLCDGVAHVLQSQTHGGLRQRTLPPAHGTFPLGRLLVPDGLKAEAAETVAALQEPRDRWRSRSRPDKRDHPLRATACGTTKLSDAELGCF